MPERRETIQSLWVRGRLSTLERLSIRSFLSHGHPYRLYTYGDVEGVPEGVEVCDAASILDPSRIFVYQTEGVGKGSLSGFSNLFRYTLLAERGGWWADTDIVCLKPFEFDQPTVISASDEGKWGEAANNCVMKAPPGDSVLTYCRDAFDRFDTATLEMAKSGPNLVQEAIREVGSDGLVPADVFCPVSWRHARWLVAPRYHVAWYNVKRRIRGGEVVGGLRTSSSAVHLWTNIWKHEGMDKNASYPRSSLYETLKQRYLPDG